MLRSPTSKPTFSPSSTDEGHPNRRGPLARHAAAAALAVLRGYKLVLSPMFAGSCRFEPSCSDYMAEAIRRFGFVHGGWLGFKRLTRCRPLGGHGFDPVPDA